MTQDTLLGFPAHTLPYRRGEFTTLSTVSLIVCYHIFRLRAINFCFRAVFENAINKSNKGKSLVTLIFLSQSEVKKP